MRVYSKHSRAWSLLILLSITASIMQACVCPQPGITVSLSTTSQPTLALSATPSIPSYCQGREDVQVCIALTEQAHATWRSFEAMTYPETGLPGDKVCRTDDGSFTPHRQTKPTNIAAYLWSIVSARDLGFIDNQEAEGRIDQTLAALERMERAHGLYFDWYDASTGEPLVMWPDSEDTVRPFLSAVDNGWLATALMIIREAAPQFASRADALLQDMDFGFFHDSKVGLLYGGYWTDTGAYTGYHYDILNTETRISTYLGIADGELPLDSYSLRHRVVPCSVWDWQEQCSEDCYMCQGLKIVPSWGGSMFEALMVELFVPEAEWGPTNWATNHPRYIQAQIKHGLEETVCGYWGFSPCNNGRDEYREYGVDCLGIRPDGYCPNNDGTTVDHGGGDDRTAQPTPLPEEYTNCVVTPHASFLALEFAPEETLENLQNLQQDFEVYGELGFYDGVNVQTGQVSRCHLALDQGMIMAALANYLQDDRLEGYFAPQIEAAVRPLLAEETFCP